LSFDLLARGVKRAVAVDASAAYLTAAGQEAIRRDRLRAIDFRHGDFVDVASTVPSATIVTMDRVICCYPAFEVLLREALGHYENGLRRLLRNPFRAFVHPVGRMTETIERAGFRLATRRQSWQWSAEVWVR
jgi:magnesium-protoporphyrin O-methyltransferase